MDTKARAAVQNFLPWFFTFEEGIEFVEVQQFGGCSYCITNAHFDVSFALLHSSLTYIVFTE
jgi:hypothetical protein